MFVNHARKRVHLKYTSQPVHWRDISVVSAAVEVLAAWGWNSGSNTSALACISSPIREVGLGIVAWGLVPGMLWLLERTYGIKLEKLREGVRE